MRNSVKIAFLGVMLGIVIMVWFFCSLIVGTHGNYTETVICATPNEPHTFSAVGEVTLRDETVYIRGKDGNETKFDLTKTKSFCYIEQGDGLKEDGALNHD